MEKQLTNLKIGERGKILHVDGDDAMKRRLWDLGFTKGTEVEAIQASPSGDPVAYRVRGTIIAIRNKDAKKITLLGDAS